MGAPIAPHEILAALAELAAALSRPTWLFGGVAVDFLAGRWTRPHGDIDLAALGDDRAQLAADLAALGYRSGGAGWLTHWSRPGQAWRLEITFYERGPADSGILVVRPEDGAGAPGRYATPPGYMDPQRFAELGGVRYRVCSAQGEWLVRARAAQIFPDRPPSPKVQHDLALLEAMIAPEELAALREGLGVRG